MNENNGATTDRTPFLKSTFFLSIILGVLCTTSVALITAIVFASKNNTPPNLHCENETTLYDIGICMEKQYALDNNVKQLIEKYAIVIERSVQQDELNLTADLIAQRTNFLTIKGHCSEALYELINQNMYNLSLEKQGLAYSRALSGADTCSDEALLATAKNKYTEISELVIAEYENAL